MIENIMNTKTMRLNEILSNGKVYKVPPFQRDYSWTEENWEDLWEDILNITITSTNPPHYMGALIFKPGDNEDEWIIVDGQQRLATLTVVAVAGIAFLEKLIENKIDEDNNRERVSLFSSKFIGEKDATSLFYRSKLHLNKNDDPFFQEYILKRKKPLNISKLKYSQKLLFKSFEYFYKNIDEDFNGDRGEKIANFLENIISKKLIFIQITVEDDLSAYTVFETLNARGIELAPTDLLKNYLFSLIPRDDLPIVEEKWYRIVNLVGFEKFPMFLRYYINSYRKIVRKERLFKEIKSEVRTSENTIELLDDLENIAYFYAALQNPYDEFWNDFYNKNDIIKRLESLNLFRVSQHLPLLIAVYRHKKELLQQALRIATVISFRYNIIGKLNPNDLEKAYNNVAMKISKGEITTGKEIFDTLKSIYINDEQFVSMFGLASLNTRRNKKIVKHILLSIEKQLSGNTYDLYDSSITIEHILPENPTEDWLESFEGEEIENYVYRLGNLTLLESSKNRDIDNKDFQDKLSIYKSSKLKITNDINFDEWNRNTIYIRQKKLAEVAKEIWRLDF